MSGQRKTIAGVTIPVVATPLMPPDRWALVTGKLSEKGKVELERRMKAGEVAEHVLAELLVIEGKAVVGRIG